MSPRPNRLWRPEIGWILLSLMPLLLAIWWIPGNAGLGSDSYSTSPSGKRAFYTAVARLIPHARVYRQTDRLLPRASDVDTILILGPAQAPDYSGWRQLLAWIEQGGTVLFAPRWDDPLTEIPGTQIRIRKLDDGSDPEEKSEDEKQQSEEADEKGKDEKQQQKEADEKGPLPTDEDNLSVVKPTRSRRATSTLIDEQVPWETTTCVDCQAEDEVLVRAAGQPQVILHELGAGLLIVASSDYLFTNQALLEPEVALLAYRVLERGYGSGAICFDEWLNRSGSPQVFGLLFTPALRPITLQLTLLLVLFGWLGSRRFGAPRPPAERPRRSITEHAEALGNLYYMAGDGHRPLLQYFEHVRSEADVGQAGAADHTVATMLLRLTTASEPEVRDWLREVQQACDSSTVSVGQAARLIRRWASWRRPISPRTGVDY